MTSRKENIQIWRDTVSYCRTHHFPYAESIPHNNLELTPIPRYDQTIVQVVNNDTFSCCQELVQRGLNVGGLNMASDYKPGGGVDSGCFAQEENCFRRSNYFESLKSKFYPIPETSCIYTPLITVIKDKNYNLLANPFTVSMIACAALRSPDLTQDGHYFNRRDRELMKFKIQQIFQVGYRYKIDTLVLSAFGCGAFRNPPGDVAEIFNEVIREYKHCFKYIIFAILSRNDDNYQIFSQTIRNNF